MIVKRIGNDVYLTWEINKKDGSPEDFSNVLDMKVYIRRSFLNKLYEQKFEVTGNVIKLHYIAAEQAGIGLYDLCAKWTKPDPMVEGGIASFVVDYRNAFKLIGFDETVPDQQDETFVSQIYEAIKGDKGDKGDNGETIINVYGNTPLRVWLSPKSELPDEQEDGIIYIGYEDQ